MSAIEVIPNSNPDENVATAANPSIDVLKSRYECPIFRILVMGRANAGKTTILQKVCNVGPKVKPIVYDRNGKKIKSSWFKKPSKNRGEHDIEHQITYPNSNFIFHDSRGFEAGAADEMNIVSDFISRRAGELDMKDRLHAIWYCIPMGDDRPLPSKEGLFFQSDRNGVPVVVVFTKHDAQINAEYSDLLSKSDPAKDAFKKANDDLTEAVILADAVFKKEYLPLVQNSRYPPKAWVRFQDLHKPEMKCSELTEQTAASIDNIALRSLFISVQKNNLALSIKDSIRLALDLAKDLSIAYSELLWRIITCFPHFWENDSWKYSGVHQHQDYDDLRLNQYDDLQNLYDEIHSHLSNLRAANQLFLADSPTCLLDGLKFILVTAIIVENSFWQKGKDFGKCFSTAAHRWHSAQSILSALQEVENTYKDHEEWTDWLCQIVNTHLLDH